MRPAGEMQPSFYFDEDVSPVYATELEKRGYTVQTTAGMGRTQKSDVEQLRYAVRQNAVLVTHNLSHFVELTNLVLASGGHHPGVIGIPQVDRLGRQRRLNEVARKLINRVQDSNSDTFQDTFQVI